MCARWVGSHIEHHCVGGLVLTPVCCGKGRVVYNHMGKETLVLEHDFHDGTAEVYGRHPWTCVGGEECDNGGGVIGVECVRCGEGRLCLECGSVCSGDSYDDVALFRTVVTG